MKNKDIPAYPTENDNKVNAGMLLLDYFAAHAPNKVPDWFKHVPIADKPKRPLHFEYKFGRNSSYHFYDIIKNHYNDEDDQWFEEDKIQDIRLLNKIKEEIKDFYKTWDDFIIADNSWNNADSFSKITQWRYTYATMMLEQRSVFLEA